MIWREHCCLYCCEKLTDCREATEGLGEMWILRVRADWLSWDFFHFHFPFLFICFQRTCVGGGKKGQEAFGCYMFWNVLSCFWAGWVVAAASFLFEGFRTSHMPLEYFLPPWKSYRRAFNMPLSWKWPQHVPTFHFSIYFFHLLFSKKHLVVIVFFHVLSCFSAGWVVVAATFLFEGFRTSHIPLEYFLPWWKSHRMAFNIALSWKWLQHVQAFIFPSISSIFFSARSICL